MKPMKLAGLMWVTGCLFAVPALVGGMLRTGHQAYRGEPVDTTDTVFGFWAVAAILFVIAKAYAWWLHRRRRKETEDFVGTVAAVSVNERGDGRDAYLVHNDAGQLVFTVWAKPGVYAFGDRLRMRQWVERRP